MRRFVFVLALGAAAAVVRATAVPITDPGFETLYKPGSTTVTATLPTFGYTAGIGSSVLSFDSATNSPSPAAYSDSTSGFFVDVPGWIGDGKTGINQSDPSSQFPGKTDNFAYINGPGFGGLTADSISQTLTGQTLHANSVYTLTVQVGLRVGATKPFPFAIDLTEGGVTLTPSPISAPPLVEGTFLTYTNTYTIGASSNGVLGIVLSTGPGAAGDQTDFDNVALSYTPEPGSLALLGIAGIGLIARRRRV